MLSRIYVAVKYHDDYVKCQAWPRSIIARTDRLAFSPDLMNERERKAFSQIDRNWRRNPCMAWYPLNGQQNGEQPRLICERGDNKRRWRPRTRREQPEQVRGWPVGIEFRYDDKNSYHFDANWLRTTGALDFRQDPARDGGFVIMRIELDGSKTDMDVALAGINGKMPCRVLADECPCWYGAPARERRC